MILLYYFNKNKINYLQMEDTLTRIEEFHAQITSLEDELNEARTETSRIKTEYLNEKSAKEIKISELQTKINEVSFITFF
jgi:chromosome segregation ATPase